MDQKDVFNILVATDNHIGFMERDPIRGGDSLESFKEILTIAKTKQVDFLLLGGDLFHENKPSRYVLHRTMELLRRFCMGPHPCSIEFRSDPSVNFVSSFPNVNYEDPNYNIDIPVFSIHGNHDDPTGVHSLSVMDLLSVNNLINYFGKSQDVEDITVSPLLMQKGSTKLALYGLGSIRDERLARMFRYNKVKFLRPKEDQGNWFNLLVLHQNRSQHSDNNHIPPSLLPSFFDLVVWGHEHECIPEVQYESNTHFTGDLMDDTEDQGFYVYQPGSSVATSLCEGEVAKKHVGMLTIKGTDFRLDTIPLKTVRPFEWDTVSLSKTGIDPLDNSRIQSYLEQKVEGLIDVAETENPDSDKIPLVRLRVDYTGDYPIIPASRFGQQFVKRVANPSTILHWIRKRPQTTFSNRGSKRDEVIAGQIDEENEMEKTSTIAALLEEQLKKEELTILSEKNLVAAVDEFVHKNEKTAIEDFVKCSLKQTQDFLMNEDFDIEDLQEKIEESRDAIMERQEKAAEEARKHLASTRSSRSSQRLSEESDEDDIDAIEKRTMATTTQTKTRGRGRGRGRGTRGSRGGTKTTKRSRQTQLDTTVSNPIVVSTTQTSTAAKKTTRTSSTSRKKTTTPKITYMVSDSDDNDFGLSMSMTKQRQLSSGESSDDPFAPPISKKKKT